MSSNLLSPSNVTYFKPSRRHINNASFLNCNRVNSAQNHRYGNPTSSFNHGFSSTSYGNPIPHIFKSRSNIYQIFRHPLRFSSRLPSLNLESSPDGEIDAARTNKNLKLAVLFGFSYLLNMALTVHNNNSRTIFRMCILFPIVLLYDYIWMFVLLFCDEFIWKFILQSLKLQPSPKIDNSSMVAVPGPALFHTVPLISISFSKVAVSFREFSHVIKYVQSAFSIVFSSFLPSYMLLIVLPIFLGCSLAAIENIYSKKSFKRSNGLNLYGWISIISLFSVFPTDVIVGGSVWVPIAEKASSFYLWMLLSRLFFHLYNQSSLETMKRVLVIAGTLFVYGNPVRPLNALGSAFAILGTFLYLQVLG